MNKNQLIFNSLNKRQQVDFLLSCHAKYKNFFGVPRIILNPKTNFDIFFSTPVSDFEKIDNLYFNIINHDELDSFLSNHRVKVIFDTTRIYFHKEDEFFKFLNSDTKKLFNLNQREIEKEKFLKTNHNHYKNEDNIVSAIIKKKLNDIWQSKWSICESYSNDENLFINNLINE